MSGSKSGGPSLSPFGVGAMSVLVDGTSVITAGLDHWYPDDNPALWTHRSTMSTTGGWRHGYGFGVPAAARLPLQGRGDDQRNVKITVPVLRFPRWCFCMYCKRLELSPLTMQQPVVCPDKEHAGKQAKARGCPRCRSSPSAPTGTSTTSRSASGSTSRTTPSCKGMLRLVSRGGGGLEGQVVTCDARQKERSLVASWTPTGQQRRAHHADRPAVRRTTRTLHGCPSMAGRARGGRAAADARRAAGRRQRLLPEGRVLDLPAAAGWRRQCRDARSVAPPGRSATLRALHDCGDDLTAAQLRKGLPKLFKPITDEELMAGYSDLFGHEGGQAEAQAAGATAMRRLTLPGAMFGAIPSSGTSARRRRTTT